jgi:cation diffusion facilitator family transporter
MINTKVEEHSIYEKKKVALISVFAAIFLTGSKTVIGILTGSLGILSEALHSGLDLVAAVITYFSVRVSDRPADKEHHYGHGKIENVSALAETILLFITCGWIIYEAVHRLITGNVHIDINIWSYVVVISSIIIDYNRSQRLMRTAKKYNSQALEADALHFSTDIWSSAVVLLGLMCANFGLYTADAIAALMVALIVVYVSYKLGKKSIEVLLDKAPPAYTSTVENILRNTPGVTSFHDIKIRTAGADVFVEMSIHLEPTLTISDSHTITEHIEEQIHKIIPRSVVHIHQEPENNNQSSPDLT